MPADLLTFAVCLTLAICLCHDRTDAAALPRIPQLELTEVRIPSSVDGRGQPVVVGVPATYAAGTVLPLLVGLHTWSAEYLQMVEGYGPEAARRQWLLLCPHFRGANLATNPRATEAGGSVLAQHDIIDAIAYVKAHYSVDDRRVYIVGGSGGGHMTCLMVTKYPDVFAAGTAWCPITDFRDWHAQQNGYAPHIEAVCGGKPGASPQVDFEYARRSPRTFITNAATTPLLIGHGDKDGVILPEQSWQTFRELRHLPAHQVVFESWSAGHDGKTAEGLDWAATKLRPLTPPSRLDIVTDEAKAYFWLRVAPRAALTLGRCTAVLVREGTQVSKDEVARRTELTLRTQDAGQVRVDLKALGLGAPQTLGDGAVVKDGELVFSPAADPGEVTAMF